MIYIILATLVFLILQGSLIWRLCYHVNNIFKSVYQIFVELEQARTYNNYIVANYAQLKQKGELVDPDTDTKAEFIVEEVKKTFFFLFVSLAIFICYANIVGFLTWNQ